MPKSGAKILTFTPQKQSKMARNGRPHVTQDVTKRKRPRKLPKFVVLRGSDWYVRKCYPTAETDAKGRIKYVQIARICREQTAEAADKIARAIDAQIKSPAVEPHPTLDQFLEGYLEAKRPSISHRTFTKTENYLYRLKRLLSMPIDQIKPTHVQAQYASLDASGKTIREIHKKLSSAFNRAVHWELIARNPCKGVILPKSTVPDVTAFTHAEAKRFIKECRKTDENIALEFALETGMRPQEYLALRWSDISGQTVHVRRALTIGVEGGGFSFGDLKTKGSRRTVEISPTLRDRLQTQKIRLENEKKRLEKRISGPILKQNKGINYEKRKHARAVARQTLANLNELNLVFPSERGTPTTINNLNRRQFKAVIEAIGLDPKDYSLYSLRHSCATLMLAEGVNMKTVADKMGHADASMLLKTYAHVLPRMRDDATKKLAAALY